MSRRKYTSRRAYTNFVQVSTKAHCRRCKREVEATYEYCYHCVMALRRAQLAGGDMGKHQHNIVPDLPYERAMNLFVVSGKGKVSTVRDCPTKVFIALVRQRLPEKDKNEWRGLNLDNPIDRWWILNRLIEIGVDLPATESFVDARASAKADIVT